MAMAYHFAFVNSDRKQTDYYGLAVADSLQALLVGLDQFGDPGSVLLKEVDCMSGVCFHAKKFDDPDDDLGPINTRFELMEELGEVSETVDDSWFLVTELFPEEFAPHDYVDPYKSPAKRINTDAEWKPKQ